MQTQPIPKGPKSRYEYLKQTVGPNLFDILEDVCLIFEVPVKKVMSKDKHDDLVVVRRIYYYVSSIITDARQEDIANLINRERSCIVHHNDLIRSWMKRSDPDFMADWELYTNNSLIWKQYGNNKNA